MLVSTIYRHCLNVVRCLLCSPLNDNLHANALAGVGIDWNAVLNDTVLRGGKVPPGMISRLWLSGEMNLSYGCTKRQRRDLL